jgi:hypothetical protein
LIGENVSAHKKTKENQSKDIGVALTELLAYVGDLLSYYQDRVATEGYLTTARTPKRKQFFTPPVILMESEPGPLQDSISVIENVVKTLENDIEESYNNWFRESPGEWVEPNIDYLVSAAFPLLRFGGCLVQKPLDAFSTQQCHIPWFQPTTKT